MDCRNWMKAVAAAMVSGALVSGHHAVHAQRQPVTHALLIGVTAYPYLEKRFQLEGPANDVRLVRDTLTGAPFSVDPRRIVELVESVPASTPAAKAAANARPTRANIERELTRLAKDVGAGDQVMILFAGHGSQQPDDDGDETDDGLDEIFLPADAQKWNGSVGRVVNAISDDDIRKWVTDIRAAGAFVWVVFDSCQSTSMTRGALERTRFVAPEDLGIPSGRLPKSRGRTAAENNILGLDRGAGDIAALYAAQSIEPTPEKALPPDADPKTAKVHGLFTYALMSALQQAAVQQTSTRLTYRDLVERVIEQYRAWGRIGPTPGFEGGGLDREVLGQKDFANTLRIVVGDTTQRDVQIRAGAIHGLTTGSILRVFPPNARPRSAAPVGHVKLTKVDAGSSLATPVEYGGQPAPDARTLTTGSYCDVAYYDYSDQIFKVAFQRDAASATHDAARNIEQALARLGKETNGRATATSSVADANWVIRLRSSGEIVAAPVSGWRIDPSREGSDEAQAPFVVAKADSTTVVEDLVRVLESVGRATNLIRLAAAPVNQRRDVNLEVDVLRYKDAQDTTGSPVGAENGIRTLHEGDQIAFRLRNTGKLPADVTLLFIDADYGITVLVPRRGQESDATIAVEKERVTPSVDVTPPFGAEQIVAIAVEARTPRQDFRALAQPALQRVRGVAARGDEPSRGALPPSPLGNLLKGAIEGRGQGATRGVDDTTIGTYAMRLLTWRTEPAKKP